jgi:hypothetical protein
MRTLDFNVPLVHLSFYCFVQFMNTLKLYSQFRGFLYFIFRILNFFFSFIEENWWKYTYAKW